MIRANKGNDLFRTPHHIYRQLNSIYRLDVDAACTTEDCKAKHGFFIDQGINGLEKSWSGLGVFCNPPFSQKKHWIKKAHDEVLFNNCPVCVMILPSNSLSSSFFHNYVFGKFHYEILNGRIAFLDKNNSPARGNDSGTVVVYFIKKISVR